MYRCPFGVKQRKCWYWTRGCKEKEVNVQLGTTQCSWFEQIWSERLMMRSVFNCPVCLQTLCLWQLWQLLHDCVRHAACCLQTIVLNIHGLDDIVHNQSREPETYRCINKLSIWLLLMLHYSHGLPWLRDDTQVPHCCKPICKPDDMQKMCKLTLNLTNIVW